MTKAGKVATLTRGQAARLVRGGRGPAPTGGAARMPFVLLVVALLGGGLISLLLLNSALNEGSFQLSKLKRETTALTDEEQALQRDVDAHSAPDALQRRAHELGLVPGGSPVFIGPDGKVAGAVSTAEAPPPPPPATPTSQPPSPAAPAPVAPPAAAPPGPAPAALRSPPRPQAGDAVTRTPAAPARASGPRARRRRRAAHPDPRQVTS
ncbi:hypothetical protein [Streptomyces sp. RerS4]|uniref:hypothetical protein n=1 Tax=Streptomyces sp. RerS4 TaxID=2942449 RepID=UPI00201B9CA1|nr:hypothetical protein [Streptomyces sp. RerS4]UQX00759.1 hypothetical protein M4D82_09645 [Streptomyces sp. RerS4]